MAVLLISAKAAFIPAPDDLAGWTPLSSEDGEQIYFRTVGEHRLYAAECISEVGRKQKYKHELLAAFVRKVVEHEPGVPGSDFYLIAHDRDLLKPGSGDEGIYPESAVETVGSSLAGLLADRHIYVFQHVARQDMFETLIAGLLDEEPGADAAITLINNCKHETSVA